MVRKELGEEGREGSASYSGVARLRGRKFCLGVELAIELRLDSGMVHTVETD
jgi:hypothetical protein